MSIRMNKINELTRTTRARVHNDETSYMARRFFVDTTNLYGVMSISFIDSHFIEDVYTSKGPFKLCYNETEDLYCLYNYDNDDCVFHYKLFRAEDIYEIMEELGIVSTLKPFIYIDFIIEEPYKIYDHTVDTEMFLVDSNSLAIPDKNGFKTTISLSSSPEELEVLLSFSDVDGESDFIMLNKTRYNYYVRYENVYLRHSLVDTLEYSKYSDFGITGSRVSSTILTLLGLSEGKYSDVNFYNCDYMFRHGNCFFVSKDNELSYCGLGPNDIKNRLINNEDIDESNFYKLSCKSISKFILENPESALVDQICAAISNFRAHENNNKMTIQEYLDSVIINIFKTFRK